MSGTAQLLPLPRLVFQDVNGNPLSGGMVYAYVPGGTTPKTTWQDSGETTPNSQPIVLDSAGSCLCYGDGDYSFTVTDASGNNIPAYSGLTQTIETQAAATVILSTVDNVAALRALTNTVINGVIVYWVIGYHTPGDGGEGFFQLNGSDTTSSDNGGTILVDASGNRWYRETGGMPLSVRWFGAYGDGSTDDTSAIQATLNIGNAWYVPPGNYVFNGLTLPYVTSFDLGGCGQASVLVQKGAGISFANLPTGIFGSLATIHDISFNGLQGTNATLNMSFAQEFDLLNLYFTEVPSSNAALILNGNTNDGTYMHDCRVRGLRIYCGDSGNGNIGLHLGAYASDTLVTDFEMQAAFTCNYCVLAEAGAATTNFTDCHIYNARLNNVGYESGGGNGFTWTACRFDYALGQSFVANNSFNNMFANCYFEAITADNNGVVLTNSSQFIFENCSFTVLVNSAAYANGCITEIGSCQNNKIIGGWLDSGTYYDDPFNMASSGDCVSNVGNFITQNRGVATWSGTSTFVVNHGLNVTPGPGDIMITPITDLAPTGASDPWVSVLTSTTFTISTSGTPSSSISIAWQARSMGS